MFKKFNELMEMENKKKAICLFEYFEGNYRLINKIKYKLYIYLLKFMNKTQLSKESKSQE